MRAAKAVVTQRKCAGSSKPSLLAYAINTKYHELAHTVWPEPSSISLSFFFLGGACNKYHNLMNWPINVSASRQTSSVNSATLKLRRRMRYSAVLYTCSSLIYFLVLRLQVMSSSRLAPHSKLVLQEPK